MAEFGGQFHALWPRGRNHDGRRFVRQTVNARVFHDEILSAMAMLPFLPEHTNDLNGFSKSLLAHLDFGPALAEDVLVEVFAGADSKKEAAG